MKLRVRKNARASRTGVSLSSKYIIINQKKGETLGMNRILSPTMEKHSFVKAFLDFLARDIQKNPSNIEPLTEDTYRRASLLTEGMEVDLDEELPEDFIFV
ncbi:type II toxin-antitoxin system PrlF family antitoxin [Dolichospermum sp. FACHB-1091]|uniref:type II toxin-antitoxin system PrlF family antitoxin n=1 Tax=Dolichospermum sp. FACHB-1091 TaxID=2692798 RepID=UPI0016815127|nr:type II toxin-antitoxin system PrlF family antitoxin [Dolichospermum sp. FACHB-1091]MBD2443589.1 type II toxin-antitoxin system PrlF family antitoxin [Dolichospermum sp. FACHB-1091]